MKRRIILLGPPGSGKGTIAGRFQQDFGLDHVSSGHLFRQEVEKGSALGAQARQFLEQGELVPDDVAMKLMRVWLETARLQKGFVLDGFPRNLTQATRLDAWLAERQAPIEAVLLFEGDEQALLERVTGRRTCPRCGRVYHLDSMPPKEEGKCDQCGAGLVQREDDSAPVMRKRTRIYARATKPLTEYYKRQNILTVIDAALPVATRVALATAAITQ